MKGLKIRYHRPDGQKREWRCNKVMAPAKQVRLDNVLGFCSLAHILQQKFEIEENNQKKKITVEEYFTKHMKYKVRRRLIVKTELSSIEPSS